MNELDWPPSEKLALQIVQRLTVAVATIEALAPSQAAVETDPAAIRVALSLSISVQRAMASGASPDQMAVMFIDMTAALPKALAAWERDDDVSADPSEWSVEGERRRKTELDFLTLRARIYPDGP